MPFTKRSRPLRGQWLLLSRERDAGFRHYVCPFSAKAQLTTGNPRDDLRLMLNADRYTGAKLAKVRFISKTYHAEATHFRLVA
jgi:hypothetical protein